MTKTENGCVSCQSPCWGLDCTIRQAEITYCDCCGAAGASYNINDEDLCEECVDEYLLDSFDNLSRSEKADLLKIQLKEI